MRNTISSALIILFCVILIQVARSEVLVYKWSLNGKEYYSYDGTDANAVTRKTPQNKGYMVVNFTPSENFYSNAKLITYWKDKTTKTYYYYQDDFIYGVADFVKNDAIAKGYISVSGFFGGLTGEELGGKLSAQKAVKVGTASDISISKSFKGYSSWSKTYTDTGATSIGSGKVSMTLDSKKTKEANTNSWSVSETLDNIKTNTLAQYTAATDMAVKINSMVFDNVEINSGTIDNTTIGGTTPAPGTFSVLATNSYLFPASDGSDGQIMKTDGHGVLSWINPASGGGISGVTAGNGLSGGGTSGTVTVDASVDDATIEVASDKLQVKDAGIAASKLAGAPGNGSVGQTLTANGSGGFSWNSLTTGVSSVFGRSGAISAAVNDYTWAQIDKSTSTLADIATRSAGDLSSGNLAAARMPTGGSWHLSSDLNLDSNTLYIDYINNHVGIGTATPSCTLDVSGNTNITSNSAYEINGTKVLHFGKGALNGNLVVGNGGNSFDDTFGAPKGGGNTFLGISAGNACTSGYYNSAFGFEALKSNTTGHDHIAIGYQALSANQGGYQSVALGNNALKVSTDSVNNTAIGHSVLKAATSGDGNTGLGTFALIAATTGEMNTACGSNAGSTITTGGHNVCLGYNADVAAASDTNSIVIGCNVQGQGDNTIMLGDSNITDLYCYDTSITSPSDRTLKENIENTDLGLDFIVQLQPVRYNYINDKNKTVREGLIAQDVKKAMNGRKFAGLRHMANGKFALGYTTFVMPLINSVKELKDENDKIKAENADLKARLSAIEKKLGIEP